MNTIVDTVVDTYRTVLKREPDADGLAFWMKSFETFLRQRGVEGAKNMLKDYFMDTEEYRDLCVRESKEKAGGK